MWNDGVAARDIVRRMGMGVTKNVIIGVVNRNRDYITRPMVYCNREKGRMSAMCAGDLKGKSIVQPHVLFYSAKRNRRTRWKAAFHASSH